MHHLNEFSYHAFILPVINELIFALTYLKTTLKIPIPDELETQVLVHGSQVIIIVVID